MTSPSVHALAAESYENQLRRGATKGDAFRHATKVLADLQRVVGGPQRAEMARVVARATLPPEVAHIVAWYVRGTCGGGSPARVLEQVTRGTSRLTYFVRLREELAWLLKALGYHPRVIGAAINRDRTSVFDTLERARARMAADELLRARMAAMVERARGGEGRAA